MRDRNGVGHFSEHRAQALALLHKSVHRALDRPDDAGKRTALPQVIHVKSVSQHFGAGRLDLCRTTRACARCSEKCLTPILSRTPTRGSNEIALAVSVTVCKMTWRPSLVIPNSPGNQGGSPSGQYSQGGLPQQVTSSADARMEAEVNTTIRGITAWASRRSPCAPQAIPRPRYNPRNCGSAIPS